MRILHRGVIALTLVTAAASHAHATEASYSCGSGIELTAIFSAVGANPAQVELLFAGEDGDTVLPQVLSADGGRYADANTEFWIKGNSATLTRSGKSETCEVKPTGKAN